uniref:HTH La-type RNA-binding domain-containing protein n=1 Tax=Chaetoceros debilis TaxID=122233 RepID=A0A7S3V6V1_9STRA|mmetsp:Transcript_10353/g.15663  ORF Transcript_10353/g.15663 Transcript_10353/m.15663 type:complete len:468 (-) Transcript_10353:340-1743(-)|eukprot:CAMPEP_0194079560 /NCGR_PEP_ID=MMETSP0149-20130528/5733_1 /TAXON_ID=122233 /ORGANISM="Chaetoceros debilis, Strain MM31A-1" /LENGTH=467 /DNA_ID=CAMNT_0038761083 /DNA_START=367 /DNA_END=1770 /DNA_ORIENTATION=+
MENSTEVESDVPVANISSDTPILENKNEAYLENSPELLTGLSKQLQYYFSPQNLAKDTYLNTIMQLNSGFVPISILVNFGNINRIVGRFATGLGMDDTVDIDVSNLLRKSALFAGSGLQIVLLNQEGHVLATHGDDNFDELKETVTFEGIGSCSTANGSNNGDEADSDASAADKASTVILRDVPESATEDDIRSIFQSDDFSPNLTSVEKEVGQCWFVTIDSATSQQDLVTILLGLRSKLICNEPIKARLKTQRIATQGVPTQGSGYNPYRGKYPSYRGSNQVYSGDRNSYYPRKYNSRPFSKPRGGRGSEGSGPYKGVSDNQKKVRVADKVVLPPPPLVEEHFPGLAGSPTSTIVTSNVEDTEENDSQGSIPVASVGGYAAALLKAAPPVPEISSFGKATSLKSETPARKKTEDSKSTTTVSTNESSGDDKSSLASKPESDIDNPGPTMTWGGGRSFAEILKSQEA